MKNNIIYTVLLSMVLLLSGCGRQDSWMPVERAGSSESRILSVHLSPSAETRYIIKDLNSKGVDLRWEVGSFDLNIVFKQGETLKIVKGVEVKEAHGESCSFEVEIPEGISTASAFDLYGVVAENVRVKNGKILVEVGAHSLYELTRHAPNRNRDGAVPVWFKSLGVTFRGGHVNATFEHLGAMAVVTIKNTSDKPLKTAGFAVVPTSGSSEFYHKAALPFGGNTELPYINLLDLSQQPESILTRVVYPSVEIAAGDVAYVGFWFRPNSSTTPEVNLVAYNATTRQPIISTNTRSARTNATQCGRAYNLYAQWDGTSLTLQDERIEKELPEEQSKIVFTTTQPIGSHISLVIGAISPEAERDVWIDLNDNGIRDLGEYVTDFASDMDKKNAKLYKVGAQKITVYGEVKDFCYYGTEEGKLTSFDVTKNTILDQLLVYTGELGSVNLRKNTELRSVRFEGCGLTSIIMPESASKMQKLYLMNNKLTTLDISSAPNILALSIADNDLRSVTFPKFSALQNGDVQNNQLNAEDLNLFITCLQKAGRKYAGWMYTISIYGNPGTATANTAPAAEKGWTVISAAPDAKEKINPSAFAVRNYMEPPSHRLGK